MPATPGRSRIDIGNVLSIEFVEPRRLHPGSDSVSVFEVAQFIEAKYELIALFAKKKQNDVLDILQDLLKDMLLGELDFTMFQVILREKVLDLWREFITKQEHSITTKLAQEEGRESFIDTGAYYRSMDIIVKMRS